jgi:ribA/ribD-fused uncharacterized protein
MASVDFAALLKTIADQQKSIDKLTATMHEFMSRCGAGAGAAGAGAAETAPKRGRKPKAVDDAAPKKERKVRAKKVCPDAAPGVVRFHTSKEGDYKDFSNLAKTPIVINGVEYPSVENFFYAMKYTGTGDAESDAHADKIRTHKIIQLVTQMGKNSKVPSRPDWETVKLGIMREGLIAKFTAHAALKELLLSTDDAVIEYAKADDAFWGIGEGGGANHLGLLLMEVRDELRDDDADSV